MGVIFGVVCFITAIFFGVMAILVARDTFREKPAVTGCELLFVYFFIVVFGFCAVVMTLFGSWLIFVY